MAKKTTSPALELVRLVNCHEGCQLGYSPNNKSQGIHQAIDLAIRYGLRFDTTDFHTMNVEFQIGDREYYYSLACGSERRTFNMTACLAYEYWLSRRPFIIRDPRDKTGKRTYVGRQFKWHDGEKWLRLTCTSFAGDGESLTACTYTDYKEKPRCKKCNGYTGHERRKIARRVKITHAMIAKFHAELRKAEGGTTN